MCDASSGLIVRIGLPSTRERAADDPARLRQERIAQAAVAVELVDGHVDERVRRQRPDGAAMPDAVLADEVRDPVLVRRELRPDRGDGLQGQVRVRRRPRRGRQAIRRRAVRQERDVDTDQDADESDADERSQHLGAQTRAVADMNGVYTAAAPIARFVTNCHFRVTPVTPAALSATSQERLRDLSACPGTLGT